MKLFIYWKGRGAHPHPHKGNLGEDTEREENECISPWRRLPKQLQWPGLSKESRTALWSLTRVAEAEVLRPSSSAFPGALATKNKAGK